MTSDVALLVAVVVIFGSAGLIDFFISSTWPEVFLDVVGFAAVFSTSLLVYLDRFSKKGRDRVKRIARIKELPPALREAGQDRIKMGEDLDLKIPIFLPDSVRLRHVHIIGSTGSGKTEGVVLNFLRQDVERGLGSIILDAKGDLSFLRALKSFVPEERRKVFDLSSDSSPSYDPLAVGTPSEACQRLFSSLTWSEEYYKSKAHSALEKLFQKHFNRTGKNPRLTDLLKYLEDPSAYTGATVSTFYPVKLAEQDFAELSGLRDQIRILCSGHLGALLSPEGESRMKLEEARSGVVLYFRLQSLLSPQIVKIVGKLLINHLNYLAGTAHRNEETTTANLIPTYLDEFASFACPEFASLTSMARSAGFALHFSHQSVGQLKEVSVGFITDITDNSATKIVMRINDPDSAEFFARTFGTRLYQKVTQRITNVKEIESAELVGEGTQREAHQYRASPDLLKTLPTGVGSVLISHGDDTPHGGASVFKIKFPRLKEEKQ